MLEIPAIIGAHWFTSPVWSYYLTDVAPVVCPDAHRFPCVWARWDSEEYLGIADLGYLHPRSVAFFPLFPLLIRVLALGSPPLMAWSGVSITHLAFVLAGLLLWQQVKLDFNESIAWGTVVAVSLFPTSFYFSAIYTESLFLLFSVLVYVLSSRKQYLLAGLAISLATLTRSNGILLLAIPLADIWLSRPSRPWLRILGTALISGIGGSIYAGYLWLTQGSPWVAAAIQRRAFDMSVDWPWRVLWNASVGAIFALRNGRGYTLSFDLLTVLLFVVLAILGLFYLKKSLAVYLAVCVLAFLPLHAHYPRISGYASMSRFVLYFFPGFIVLAILLRRYPRLGQVLVSVSAVALLVLTGLFTSGRFAD